MKLWLWTGLIIGAVLSSNVGFAQGESDDSRDTFRAQPEAMGLSGVLEVHQTAYAPS